MLPLGITHRDVLSSESHTSFSNEGMKPGSGECIEVHHTAFHPRPIVAHRVAPKENLDCSFQMAGDCCMGRGSEQHGTRVSAALQLTQFDTPK